MGKVFGENKSKLIPLIFFTFVLLSPIGVSGSGREFELFDRGYESYIAYQPEKAVKEFRTFLEEFPRSSAKDAAMFWLGKSLVHLEFLEEARQVFSNIITEFPDSPFRGYAERELDTISGIPSEYERLDSKKSSIPEGEVKEAEAKGAVTKEEEAKEEEAKKTENSVKEPSEGLSTIAGERDELRPLFEEEKVKTVELHAREEEVEKKEAYIATSSFVLSRLGVTDIAWRSEDILKDIEIEQLLYEKAKSLNISADPEMYQELVEKYHFNSEEAEYLQKFLSICELVDMNLRDRQGERVVESLVVRYEEGDRYKKISLSTDLQKKAKSGMPFADISKMHSDIVEFKVVKLQDLEEWIKEKIYHLQNNEIGVIWSEESYMLLKPVVKKISCNPFEEMKPEVKDRIKTSVEELLREIRGQDGVETENEK